jgi:hypothetical protein
MTAAVASGVEANLLDLFQTLGIGRAHIAAGGPPVLTDWHGLVTRHPERVASLILPSPPILDTAELEGIASRLLVLAGRSGRLRTGCDEIARGSMSRARSIRGYGGCIVHDGTQSRLSIL